MNFVWDKISDLRNVYVASRQLINSIVKILGYVLILRNLCISQILQGSNAV